MKVAVIPKDSEILVPGILSLEVALADALEGLGEEDALNDHLESSQGGEEGEVEVVVEIVPFTLAGVEGVGDSLPHGEEWSEDGETGGGSEHGIDEITAEIAVAKSGHLTPLVRSEDYEFDPACGDGVLERLIESTGRTPVNGW